MVPSYFVRMEKFPLNPNGKVDRKALPDPAEAEMNLGTEYMDPRDESESALVAAWSDILGRDNIGIHDNYFALGGDSIKAIQIASRLAQSGWKLELRDLFRYPSVAELGAHIVPARQTGGQEDVSGTVPLTAVQKWFFQEVNPDRHHFNQAILLKGKPCFKENVLQTVLDAILKHHDALRLQYITKEKNIIQRYTDPPPSLHFEILDLRGKDNAFGEMEAHANMLQSRMELEKGLLMKTALYRTDDEDRLLIAIHHLAVDGVSWRILLEDLNKGYDQAISGQPVHLSFKTSSFQAWAEKIYEHSQNRVLTWEKDYWLRLVRTSLSPLPSDFKSSRNLIQHSETVLVRLSEKETELLLRGVNHAYNTRADDLLLTALVKAFKSWTGEDRILILLEGHGRESVIKDIDISRTVGWFTSMCPVLLTLPETEDSGQQIKEIKETLRKIPNRGIGYGLLRYLAEDDEISALPQSEISFNYLGQFDEDADTKWFSFAEESPGQMVSSSQKRPHALDINGMVLKKQLNLAITYDGTRFLKATIQRFLENYCGALRELIEHCQNRKEKEKTPGDFSYSDLTLGEFGDILEELK